MNKFITYLTIVFLFINFNTKAIGKASINNNLDSYTFSNASLQKRASKKMPNLFIGGTYMTFNAGRMHGLMSYSFDGVYNNDLFSVQFKSIFAHKLGEFFPNIELEDREKHPDAYRKFNQTEIFGTYYFFDYKSNQKYIHFTGEMVMWFGNLAQVYKKNTTQKTNKLGARLGIFHDQENVLRNFYYINTPNNFTITSYSANNLMIGISKTSFAYAPYGKYNYTKNSNWYFDILLKLSSNEKYIVEPNNSHVYENLYLFPYKLGWRVGWETRTNNSKNKFLVNYFGLETGVLPVPKYKDGAGIYFSVKIGVMFKGNV